ncbi:hypothetical protein MY4824_009228 [Beauveria thailandica]
MAPLRDNQKLDLLWSMGKALVEPEGTVMVFYGRDGKEGKTKLISSITSTFTNAVEWVSEDLVRKESKWPGPDTIISSSLDGGQNRDVVTMTFVAGEIRTGMGENQYGYTTLKSFRNRVEYLDKIKSGVMQMNV